MRALRRDAVRTRAYDGRRGGRVCCECQTADYDETQRFYRAARVSSRLQYLR